MDGNKDEKKEEYVLHLAAQTTCTTRMLCGHCEQVKWPQAIVQPDSHGRIPLHTAVQGALSVAQYQGYYYDNNDSEEEEMPSVSTNEDAAKHIMELHPQAAHVENEHGETPLSLACSGGDDCLDTIYQLIRVNPVLADVGSRRWTKQGQP